MHGNVIYNSAFLFNLTSQFLDLLEAMKSCLEIIKAFPFLLDVVYNIKEWLSSHAEELHAHTQPEF